MPNSISTNPRNALGGNLKRNLIFTIITLLLLSLFASNLSATPALWPRHTSSSSSHLRENYWPHNYTQPTSEGGIRCPESPLARDVVLVFKTGVTEHERVASHLATDLACPQNLIGGSDVEEDIEGLHLKDALKDIDPAIQASEAAFDFYHQLQDLAKTGHLEQAATWAKHGADKEEAMPWKLDKWKFFPLLSRTVRRYPYAKWYVFMEADTYILWSNFLALLERLDHTMPVYMGASNFIGDTEYAHGGSGYALSARTAHAAADWIENNPEKAVQLVRDNCCGDLVMGLLLKEELDTGLTMAWPSIQGETPATQDYTERHWCVPIASLHHMLPDDVSRMSAFEQSRLESSRKPILHRDVYNHFVRPRLEARKDGWDNLSDKEESLSSPGDAASESFEACQKLCKEDKSCLQFSWRLGECNTSPIIRLGSESTIGSIASGFMIEKIEHFTIHKLGSCKKPVWPNR